MRKEDSREMTIIGRWIIGEDLNDKPQDQLLLKGKVGGLISQQKKSNQIRAYVNFFAPMTLINQAWYHIALVRINATT